MWGIILLLLKCAHHLRQSTAQRWKINICPLLPAPRAIHWQTNAMFDNYAVFFSSYIIKKRWTKIDEWMIKCDWTDYLTVYCALYKYRITETHTCKRLNINEEVQSPIRLVSSALYYALYTCLICFIVDIDWWSNTTQCYAIYMREHRPSWSEIVFFLSIFEFNNWPVTRLRSKFWLGVARMRNFLAKILEKKQSHVAYVHYLLYLGTYYYVTASMKIHTECQEPIAQVIHTYSLNPIEIS